MDIKATLLLKIFGLFKVPMLFYARPVVTELNAGRITVKIPLSRRNKNHLGSMYFGALAIGADCAGGIYAAKLIKESGENISFVFKDFEANFLQRPESDTYFTCKESEKIEALVKKAISDKVRVQETLRVTATCPEVSGDKLVAEFKITLSLKHVTSN